MAADLERGGGGVAGGGGRPRGLFGFAAWGWLLTRYPATRVQAFVFLTPVFGTLFAAWLLDEPIGHELLVGLVAVAVGLRLLNRRPA